MKLRSGTEVAPVANEIAQNPKTFHAVAQHNASSSFLTLPQEIKNRIYHFVCGGQIVHILQNDHAYKHAHGDHSVKLSHALCVEPTSEKQIQKDFDSADPDTAWNLAALDHRHQDCHKPPPMQTKRPGPRPNQLSLAILRSCRQVYFEANTVPYTNNTFAIGCNDILERFARARSQNKQNLLVRSLYLYFSIAHGRDVTAWSVSVDKAVLRRLTSVRCLNLNLGQLYCPCSVDMCGYEGSEMTECQRNMLKKFSKLPLKEATLVVDDETFMQHHRWEHYAQLEQEYRWTLKQKQDFSREIRDYLLSGGGNKKAKRGREAVGSEG